MFNIDELLRSVDLADLARKEGAKLKQSYGEWRGPCPIHNGNNPTGFVIYESGGKQVWHCFTRDCGGGDAIDFIQKKRGCDFVEACHILGGKEADAQAIHDAAIERAKRASEDLEQKIAVAQKALSDLRAADIHLQYHENLDSMNKRSLWQGRGITNDLQNWWKLGYREKYSVKTGQGWWSTPTITIPIYGPGFELLNVRHRLLTPYNPKDKYRPERAGLSASAFMAAPDIGWNVDRVLVVEGEIKSMVAWNALCDQNIQVIGIPGKKSWGVIADDLRGHDVYICFDPDADDQAEEAAKQVGGRLIRLPDKIDDLILNHGLGKSWMHSLMRSARKVSAK